MRHRKPSPAKKGSTGSPPFHLTDRPCSSGRSLETTTRGTPTPSTPGFLRFRSVAESRLKFLTGEVRPDSTPKVTVFSTRHAKLPQHGSEWPGRPSALPVGVCA